MPAAARPIFGPATALLVGLASQALQVRCPKVTCASRKAVSPLRGCSLLAPGGRPKSLAGPSALICEMTSNADPELIKLVNQSMQPVLEHARHQSLEKLVERREQSREKLVA